MGKEELRRYIDKTKPVMEIGPLNRPFLQKGEYNVFYADIHDKEDIYHEYTRDGLIYSDYGASSKEAFYESILPIDYVVADGYKNTVQGRRFAAVYSSHVIEHTTDLLRHLLDVGDCLEEDGYLVMTIPDKRHTFDHFREVTPFRDVWDVYKNGQSALARLAFDAGFAAHTVNNPFEYTENRVSFLLLAVDDQKCTDAIADYDNTVAGEWPNTHLWVFTYFSFLELIRDCLRMNVLPFTLEYACATPPGANDFGIVLKKCSRILEDGRLRRGKVFEIQQLLDQQQNVQFDINKIREFCAGENPVYVYGAGSFGNAAFALMRENLGLSPTGFVVSDGQEKPASLHGLPVYHLSELDALHGPKAKVRILLALRFFLQVENALKQKGYDYINFLKM